MHTLFRTSTVVLVEIQYEGLSSTTNLGDEKLMTLFIMYLKCPQESTQIVAKKVIEALTPVLENCVLASLHLRGEMNYAVRVRQAWR